MQNMHGYLYVLDVYVNICIVWNYIFLIDSMKKHSKQFKLLKKTL
jgi:hypothetical protein